jgi:uncharacterized protein
MTRCLTFLALGVLLTFSANVMADGQDVSPEKRAAIEKLLEITGAMKLGQQFSSAIVTQLTNTLRATHANVPQKALDALPEVVDGVFAENIGALKEILVHIYDEHLTLQDVEGLNQFYSTDLGQRVIRTLPSILQESLAAGQKWGQALGPELASRLREHLQKERISL